MDPAQTGVETGQQEAVQEKVVINGQEYDVSQASELIGLGQKTREYEQRWNTSLDKVWPEYGRTTQTLKSIQEENARLKSQLHNSQSRIDAGIGTQEDVMKAQEAARKLGLVLNEDLSTQGYIKKSDLESYLENREKEKDAVNQVLQTADKLEKEIDGTDGRPRFNKKHVLAYASAYGIPDLQQAYNEMHDEAIKSWQASKIEAKKPAALRTLKGGVGSKAPAPIALNDNNVNDALKEALWGTKE